MLDLFIRVAGSQDTKKYGGLNRFTPSWYNFFNHCAFSLGGLPFSMGYLYKTTLITSAKFFIIYHCLGFLLWDYYPKCCLCLSIGILWRFWRKQKIFPKLCIWTSNRTFKYNKVLIFDNNCTNYSGFHYFNLYIMNLYIF